jgi:hypothetical protein
MKATDVGHEGDRRVTTIYNEATIGLYNTVFLLS